MMEKRHFQTSNWTNMAYLSFLNPQITKMTHWSVRSPPFMQVATPTSSLANLLALQNWSPSLKLAVLMQIAFLSMIAQMASATVNPAFVPLSAAFEITPVQASYELAVYVSI